jgi:hypothetical protein
LEWLHPMDLRNSEAILFHPMDFVPGGSHGTVGRMGQQVKPTKWRAGGRWVGGECKQPQGHKPNKLG